jgi:CRP/FNR family transcriptional regulator
VNAAFHNALAACGYFRGLSSDGLATLAAVCRQVDKKKRETVFIEGEKGRAVYLLLAGSVQLAKASESGREIVIRTVVPDELFAEAVLFEEEDYPVTATAIRDSRLCAIPKSDFLRLLREERFRTDFLRTQMRRMRYLADRILYLTTGDAEDRFFGFLAEQYGRKEEYHLAISKKDIAAAIGTTPETLSRLKEKLTARRTVRWEGRTLRLPAGFWSKQ